MTDRDHKALDAHHRWSQGRDPNKLPPDDAIEWTCTACGYRCFELWGRSRCCDAVAERKEVAE